MNRRGTGAGAAFTLIEVLVVVALIALMGTLLVAGSVSLLRDQGKSPQDVFWQACLQARREALQSGQDVNLAYDPDARAFTLDDGASTKAIPIPSAPADLKITFVPADNGANDLQLIGGTEISSESLPWVTFFHDGICTPFQVQFFMQGAAHLVAVDPWTCAPVLPAVSAGS